MHFEGEFRVPGKAADVIRRFADVPRMARCMPGAVLEPQAEDGSWPGAMVVAFGPKKVNFKGRATCEFDFDALTGRVQGRGAADMRAARIGVKVAFTLSDDAAAARPTTLVKIVSDSELGGVLADFARTGGIAVANAIMADFARRAAEEFAKDDSPPPSVAAEPAPRAVPSGPEESKAAATPAAPPPLAAHRLVWVVIKAYLARLGRWLGIGR
jgi:uncharacterized protein